MNKINEERGKAGKKIKITQGKKVQVKLLSTKVIKNTIRNYLKENTTKL